MADSNGPKIIITLWILTILPLIFMLLRFYCKTRYSKLFGWDDTLLAIAWVLRPLPATSPTNYLVDSISQLHRLLTTLSILRHWSTPGGHPRQDSAANWCEIHVHWRDLWLVLRTIEQSIILLYSFASHSHSMAKETSVVHHNHGSADLLCHSGHYLGTMPTTTKSLGCGIAGEVLGQSHRHLLLYVRWM